MIRRPPRSTLDRSSAASDVYKRQAEDFAQVVERALELRIFAVHLVDEDHARQLPLVPVSYTHLRAHETVLDLVCRLLLENKNNTQI